MLRAEIPRLYQVHPKVVRLAGEHIGGRPVRNTHRPIQRPLRGPAEATEAEGGFPIRVHDWVLQARCHEPSQQKEVL